ncbi:DUF6542 domain-containing protein [Sphaerisporangium rufum]|uniref:DUF6542 domain-containing protein n=1 Tax=Sphaerisporangium rufum TaxID=1381558 RepID=UPI00195026CC|nr:DUF6542 domain-containing protein [Sphaerisporangium rufum]
MRPGLRLTARGAAALILVVTIAAEITGVAMIIGLVFCGACLGAVLLVQHRDLLALVVTPPVIFFAATLVSALTGALGAPSLVQALGLGLVTGLSAGAPWLFGGSALVLAVAWFRGLPANVREIRAEVRASRAAARPDAAAAPAGAPDTGAAAGAAPPPGRPGGAAPGPGRPRGGTARPGKARGVAGETPGGGGTPAPGRAGGVASGSARPGGDGVPAAGPEGATRPVPREREAKGPGGRRGARRRPAAGSGYAPEPEGYFEPRVYGSPREPTD